jgi:hypothetical protein
VKGSVSEVVIAHPPSQRAVSGVFALPSGKTTLVPAFWCQGYPCGRSERRKTKGAKKRAQLRTGTIRCLVFDCYLVFDV